MRHPNILILYTDQQRWDALGANGNSEILTPHLDRLAGEGVNFDHCFVQNPVCMPSRVSFLTGRYPSSLRITHMGVPVPPDTVALSGMLGAHGYRCANIGKLHFLPHSNRDHREVHPAYGFHHLEVSDEPGVYEDAYRAWVRRVAPDQLDLISVGLPPCTANWYRTMRWEDPVRHPDPERYKGQGAVPAVCRNGVTHTAFVADQTIEFLRREHVEPFLCIAGFYSPHSPWVVPQQYLDRYDPSSLSLPDYPPEIEAERASKELTDEHLRSVRHGYYAMVSEVDDHVGRILAALAESGRAEETIVVFTSDHGEWLGEHLMFGKGYPGHDSVSRVPLLVRWPGGISNPRTVDGLVEAVDVVPTLLECCGLPVPPEVQGRSLAGVLTGDGQADREDTLIEFTGSKILRTDTWRYILHADGREHLYDLTAPYGEYRDVAAEADRAGMLSGLRHRLATRMVAMEQPRPRVWPY